MLNVCMFVCMRFCAYMGRGWFHSLVLCMQLNIIDWLSQTAIKVSNLILHIILIVVRGEAIVNQGITLAVDATLIQHWHQYLLVELFLLEGLICLYSLSHHSYIFSHSQAYSQNRCHGISLHSNLLCSDLHKSSKLLKNNYSYTCLLQLAILYIQTPHIVINLMRWRMSMNGTCGAFSE